MKYVEFVKVYDTGKTSMYDVVAIKNGEKLGIVKWYSHWRQYAFFPKCSTLYSAGCLVDVSDFISDLMAGR